MVVDDVDEVQADLRLMDIFTGDASQQMKIAVDTQVLSGLVGAGSADNIGSTAGRISNDIVGTSTGGSRLVESSNI